MRTTSTILSLCLASASVLAQSVTENSTQVDLQSDSSLQSQAQPADKQNQRIERIRIEDEGSRVDELRVGGETKAIKVQPKVGNLPAYEVQPQKPENSDGANGRRVWRAIQF